MSRTMISLLSSIALIFLSAGGSFADPISEETDALDEAAGTDSAGLYLEETRRITPLKQWYRGKPLAQFWKGFEVCSSVAFRTVSTVGSGDLESRREEVQLSSRDGAEVEMNIRREDGEYAPYRIWFSSSHSLDGYDGYFNQKPVDRKLSIRWTLKVGDREYKCDVYERTAKTIPRRLSGEPNYRIERYRAWRCPEVKIDGGFLLKKTTWEEDWGKGLQVVRTREETVTDLAAKKTVDGVDVACEIISIKESRGSVILEETTEWRSDEVPGGFVESKGKRLIKEDEDIWQMDHTWIAKMNLIRPDSGDKSK